MNKWCNHCKEYHNTTDASKWLSVVDGTVTKLRCRKHEVEKTARWRMANRDKVRESNKRTKATISARYSSLKSRSFKKGIPTDISLQQYADLVSTPCIYCNTTHKINLDRINNDKGYTRDNVVPCCMLCNLTRNNLYTQEEFIKYIAPAIMKVRHERETAENTWSSSSTSGDHQSSRCI